MLLYIVLDGASKHAAALIMPCGSYQFLYDSETNRHLLDGGPLTPERFNEAVAFFLRNWPESAYQPLPWVVPALQVEKPKPLKPVPPRAGVPAPALSLA